ncbi:DUF397 domain-containing protein [Nocardiopsis sp. NPDC006938]|uniref:DUF397 domain-containing protein n=1 Tax=Nocardiopsis sp. NPDC006938 TaxID=3364337 RepID=UPI0036C57A79
MEPAVDASWRKSSYSPSEGNCLEVSETPGGIFVRDSKNPSQSVLLWDVVEWSALISLTHIGRP